MSNGKGRSVGADTTGKAVSRTSKLRSTDAGSGVPGGPSRGSGMCQWHPIVKCDRQVVGRFAVTSGYTALCAHHLKQLGFRARREGADGRP